MRKLKTISVQDLKLAIWKYNVWIEKSSSVVRSYMVTFQTYVEIFYGEFFKIEKKCCAEISCFQWDTILQYQHQSYLPYFWYTGCPMTLSRQVIPEVTLNAKYYINKGPILSGFGVTHIWSVAHAQPVTSDRWHLCWIFAKWTVSPLKEHSLWEHKWRCTITIVEHFHI
jgi:hypothetical protein